MVASDVVKLQGIVIRNNTISDAHFGIWTKNDGNMWNVFFFALTLVSVKVTQS